MERNEADRWRDRLSEYLDEELERSERAELEKHLEGCPECQETLAALRQVVARARTLVDAPPARDLWLGIARRIRAVEEGRGRHVAEAGRRARGSASKGRVITFSMPQPAAAAVTLVALSSALAWQISAGFSARRFEQAAAAAPAPATSPVAPAPATLDLLPASRFASQV